MRTSLSVRNWTLPPRSRAPAFRQAIQRAGRPSLTGYRRPFRGVLYYALSRGLTVGRQRVFVARQQGGKRPRRIVLQDHPPTPAASIACFTHRNALHCHALRLEDPMALAAERMKAMRQRRRARGLRELRLIVPDARSKAVRRRVAKAVASLDRARELEGLGWIEAVSEFDAR